MTAVALLAKAPRAGLVKTRLARQIGAARAVAIYRAVGVQVVRQVGAVFPLTVWYEPHDALEEMRWWLGEWEYRPQPPGDLGARLTHAFAVHWARGDRPVIAIGADCPGVDAGVIESARRALQDADVVLGPALDGGYYLVGLSRAAPEIFRDIPWGGGDVLAATERHIARWGLRAERLPPLRDVDTADDVRALRLERP